MRTALDGARLSWPAVAWVLVLFAAGVSSAQDIIHDAEHYILQAQNGERWAADDRAIDQRLSQVRTASNGKRPNIVYILLDDIGYGEIGTPGLTPSRGYSTPHIDALSRQGLTCWISCRHGSPICRMICHWVVFRD